MIDKIHYAGTEYAFIIRHEFNKDGVEFFTPSEYSQQIGYMKRTTGHVIPPHVHNPVHREVHYTREVLFIKSGRVRVDFYDNNQKYLESTILRAGDVVLLAFGGHGFEILEESEIIEVKQGPYAGDKDKSRFEPVAKDRINIR
jgi:mannose-6-phosphate isomerase-like protein (cupin superfamily)